MDDERILRDTDARLRAALAPDPAAQRRVLERALGGERPRPRRRLLVYVLGGMASLALLAGSGVWQWRRADPPRSPSSLTVTGRGSTVVVENQDGRRWVLGPSPERRAGGNYVIAVQR